MTTNLDPRMKRIYEALVKSHSQYYADKWLAAIQYLGDNWALRNCPPIALYKRK